MAIAEHLDLDVAGIDNRPLQNHGGIAKRARRLRSRAAQRIGKRSRIPDQPHAAPAAAGDGLDHDGKTDLAGLGQDSGIALVRTLIAGNAGNACRLHDLLGAGLVAHGPDRFGRRPDEHQTGVAAGLRQPGVLGEEPVAGMDRVGAAGPGRRNNGLDPKIGLRRRRLTDADRLIRLAHMQRVGDRHRNRPRPRHGQDGARYA